MKKKNIMLTVVAAGLVFAASGFSLMNAKELESVAAQTSSSITIVEGAAVRKTGRIVSGVEQEATPALRFVANVADKTKDYGMIIVPWDYVEKLDVTAQGFDYYDALVGEGKKYLLFKYDEESEIGTYKSKDSIIGSIDQIMFENINREYIAIAYYDGENGKEYATVDAANARSAAWVSAAALNDGETGKILETNVALAGYQLLGVTYAESQYVYGGSSYATLEELSEAVNYQDAFALAHKGVYAKIGDKVDLATDNLKELEVKWVSTNEDVATVDENGQITALTSGKTTVKAYVGTDVENALFVTECPVDIATEAVYARTLDPLSTPAFEGTNITSRKNEWATFSYDSTENAYKYHATMTDTTTNPYYNNHLMLVFGKDSRTATMINENISSKAYDYVALDLKYSGVMGTDFGEFMFLSSGDRNTMLELSQVKICNADGTIIEKSAMTAGEWYTMYIPMPTALTEDPTCAAYCFIRQGATGATAALSADYWVRNARLENMPLQVQNGGVYEEANIEGVLPKSTAAYVLEVAPEGVTLTGNKLSSLKAGEYKAVGDTTVSFTVYTATEFAKIIAPLTNGSYDDCVGTRDNKWATFTYDATEGAYKYHATMTDTNVPSYADNHVVTTLKGVAAEKIVANAASKTYAYVALDLKYSGTMGTDFNSFEFSVDGTRSGLRAITHSTVKVCNQNGQIINASEMQEGEWYTIYMVAPTTFTVDLNVYFFIRQTAKTPGVYQDYWVRNVRFATELPTA